MVLKFFRKWLSVEPKSTCPHPEGHSRLPRPVTPDRLNASNRSVTLAECVGILADYNKEAAAVLLELLHIDPMGIYDVDSKRLYGARIVELFRDVCGSDIQRFYYHLTMELPHQETGHLSTAGDYVSRVDDSFSARRMCGEPGSFWALPEGDRPTTSDYVYPIV